MSNDQDIPSRRVYVITPKKSLIAKLSPHFNIEELARLSEPHVVMTAELPFEKYLEGWRSAILKKCKEAFIEEQKEYGVFFDLNEKNLSDLLGPVDNISEFFDQWWFAAEAGNYIEITTDWQDQK